MTTAVHKKETWAEIPAIKAARAINLVAVVTREVNLARAVVLQTVKARKEIHQIVADSKVSKDSKDKIKKDSKEMFPIVALRQWIRMISLTKAKVHRVAQAEALTWMK